MYVCMYVYIYIYMYVCMYVYIYIYIYIYVIICVYIYIYIWPMFLAYVFGDIPPKYMTLYGTVAPFDDPETSIERMVIFPNILLAMQPLWGKIQDPAAADG